MTLTGNPLSVTAGVCFPFAERQDGWHGGPGASLILPPPLPDAQEAIVSVAFMPGWHRADRGPAPKVPGLPGYSLHSSRARSLAPSPPSVPPSAFSFLPSGPAAKAAQPRMRLGVLSGREVRGTFPE